MLFWLYFVHLRQKAHLRPELSPKFLSTLGSNPTRKVQPDLQLWSPKCHNQNIVLGGQNFFKRGRKLQAVFFSIVALEFEGDQIFVWGGAAPRVPASKGRQFVET